MPAENVVIGLVRAQTRRNRVEHRLRAFDAGLGEHDRELLAAVARDAVDLAGGVAEVAGEAAQRLVAHLVTVAVVHLLEVVEVDEHQRVAGPHGRRARGRTSGGSRVRSADRSRRRG